MKTEPQIHCAHDETRPPNELKPHPRNPNRHSDNQVKLLAKIIAAQGWRAPVVVSQRSGYIVAGHARLAAARALGAESLPVCIQNFESEAQEDAHLLADNRLAELAELDKTDLTELLKSLEGKIDLDLTGFDSSSLDELLGPPAETKDAEPKIDQAAELQKKWGTKLGQIWELGDHRIACGDSTELDVVKKFIGDDRAEVVFTDPPYGVNVKGGKNKRNTIAGDLTQTAIPFSFEIAVDFAASEKAKFYFCGGEGNIGLYHKLFDRYLAQLPRMLIWVKNGFVMKPNGYHNQYELIFYGYRAGGGGISTWYSGRTELEASDVWQIKRDNGKDYLHPTQKPIELATRAITNSCKKGGIVYEPFLGSGSTLMACENLGRKCRAIEIDPGYVAVTIERWHEATGREPKSR